MRIFRAVGQSRAESRVCRIYVGSIHIRGTSDLHTPPHTFLFVFIWLFASHFLCSKSERKPFFHLVTLWHRYIGRPSICAILWTRISGHEHEHIPIVLSPSDSRRYSPCLLLCVLHVRNGIIYHFINHFRRCVTHASHSLFHCRSSFHPFLLMANRLVIRIGTEFLRRFYVRAIGCAE